MRYEVLTAANKSVLVFCVVTPCGLVGRNPWRCMQYISPKCFYLPRSPNGVITYKVNTDSINATSIRISLTRSLLTYHHDRAMAQAISRLPVNVEARILAQVSPCGISGIQSDSETHFSQSSSVFPCQSFHFILIALSSAEWIIGPLVKAFQRHSLVPLT
jgi:hypothetical protein